MTGSSLGSVWKMTVDQAKSVPKRVLFSYALDWLVILVIAAIGAGLNFIRPSHRRFSLSDLSISYPRNDDLIPTWLLVVCALVVPILIIGFVVLVIVPGPSTTRALGIRKVLVRKLWELNAGFMGLGLSLAVAFTLTQAGKQMFGKPRPNLLSRCNPDLDAIQAAQGPFYAAGMPVSWVLVDTSICHPESQKTLDEGFRSFPSGHSSLSMAGLFYLSLFLCSKLSIFIPVLHPRPFVAPTLEDQHLVHEKSSEFDLEQAGIAATSAAYKRNSAASRDMGVANQPTHGRIPSVSLSPHALGPRSAGPSIQLRKQAASPPTHLVIIAAIPVCAAVYIASTRYIQYDHFGIDVFAGCTIGVLSAWLAFRWYHQPLSSGAGWAWAPRSSSCAFGIGVGAVRYVDHDDDDGSSVHPAFRDPRLDMNVPVMAGARLSVARSTRNSVLIDPRAGSLLQHFVHSPVVPPSSSQLQLQREGGMTDETTPMHPQHSGL